MTFCQLTNIRWQYHFFSYIDYFALNYTNLIWLLSNNTTTANDIMRHWNLTSQITNSTNVFYNMAKIQPKEHKIPINQPQTTCVGYPVWVYRYKTVQVLKSFRYCQLFQASYMYCITFYSGTCNREKSIQWKHIKIHSFLFLHADSAHFHTSSPSSLCHFLKQFLSFDKHREHDGQNTDVL